MNAMPATIVPQSQPRPKRGFRHTAGRLAVAISLVGCVLTAAGLSGATGAAASAAPSLLPDAGQFVSVPIARVLDTRNGTGGVPSSPIPAGGTVTFPVAGVAGVPASADSAVLDISALNPTSKGFLTIYDSNSPDPGVAAVGMRAGTMTNQNATVPVSTTGTVSLTNHSSGTVDVVASVTGYDSGAGQAAAGDTYFALPWSIAGSGVSIAAGGTHTFQVTGQGGVPAGADTAVVQLNTFGSTASGYLTAYAAGSSDAGVAALAYNNNTLYRNLLTVPLSASGQITVGNHGTAPTGVTVWVRGYYMPPTTTPAGGEYTPVDPQLVYGTASAGTQLAANASTTFQVTGNGDIPASGVSAVTEDVVASNPATIGHLDEGPTAAGVHTVVSFLGGDAGYTGYDNGILSTLSPSGQETITNVSSGTVNVQVAVTGVYLAARAPGPPVQVAATVSGSSATVTWQTPVTDGGSPITGYTITAPPDNASVTVGPGTLSATLTGLSSAAADTYTVTATNATGASGTGSYTPQAAVISGRVLAPTAAGATAVPVPNDTVAVFVTDPPTDTTTSWTPTQIGSATTDANGYWSYTVPPYSLLPAAAQAAADSNGGILNTMDVASGTATSASGTTEPLQASTWAPAWVGSATPATPPSGAPKMNAMTLRPQGPDASGQLTPPAIAAAWTTKHDYATTGQPADVYAAPQIDAYGFQEVGQNGPYNPNMAADGIDVTGRTVTPADTGAAGHGCVLEWTKQIGNKWDRWVTIGEAHGYYDANGGFNFQAGGEVTADEAVSLNLANWGITGDYGIAARWNWADNMTLAHYQGQLAQLHTWFKHYRTDIRCRLQGDTTYDYVSPAGIDNVPNSPGAVRFSGNVSYLDGKAQWQGYEQYAGNNVNYIPRTWTRCIGGGSTQSYSVSLSIVIVTVTFSSSYSRDVQQCIAAGTGTRHWHWEWGLDGPYTSRNAHVLYSY